MKIFVIESSPHKISSSNMLAGEFIKGATEAGHSVSVFDAGKKPVSPCIACDICRQKGRCFKDDMNEIKAGIREADMIVFVTPLYYFGMSAQLKNVIDRFYSFNDRLTEKKLKSALICAGYDTDYNSFAPLEGHYKTIADFLKFENMGVLMGLGCGTPEMTQNSQYMQKAYEFGKKIY